MIVRSIESWDYKEVKEIHEKYYKEEFEFPGFLNNYLMGIVVEDDSRIIVCGGIRTIVEAVAVTNKDIRVEKRREALYNLLNASTYYTRKKGYNQLHAFIQDPKWERHLIKAGFHPTKGHSLVMEI